jgi:Mechanosensitive ion channel, conserved TM helix
MAFLDQLTTALRDYLPNLLVALAILVFGWVAATVIARLVKLGLKRTTIDNKIADWMIEGDGVPVEDSVSRVVFWLLMLFVLVGFFQAIGLTLLTQPLNQLLSEISAYAPRVLGAAALLAIAWIVATALRALVSRGLQALKVDERLSRSAATEGRPVQPLHRTVSEAAYWLVFLLFLPAILGALALEGLLRPVQDMMSSILSYLPNVVTALVIVIIGWFIARVIQRVVENLLSAVGVDQLGARTGVQRALGKNTPSRVLGLIVYVLVLLPVLIASLDALNIEAITRPASDMLGTMLSAVPVLFAAAVILVVAFVLARLVAGLVTSLLAGIGFDALIIRLGVMREPQEDRYRPSAIVGAITLIAILVFAGIEAFSVLGFATLSGLLAELTVFGGKVLLGAAIFAFGLFLANVAAGAVESSGVHQSRTLAVASRVTIMVLAGAIALQEIGIANGLITLAIGLTLGSAAIALAVAFGVGGREIATKKLEEWQESWRGGAPGR